jgi:lipopolysaccharide transport system permease protein
MSSPRESFLHLLSPAAFSKNLWIQRGLLWQFTVRNVAQRYRGNYLGLIWSLLNPLLILGLYVYVFGYIFHGSFRSWSHETKWDYALGLFLGITIFQVFGEVLVVAPSIMVSSPNLVKKVVFPLEVLPAASVGSAVFHMMISLGLVLLGVATLGPGLTYRTLWLPLVLLPVVPLALGLSWFLAAAGVFLRDVNQITGFASLALMYSSALFYPASIIPKAAWLVMRFNPVLLTIELSRDVTMWHLSANLVRLAYLWGVGLVVGTGGYAYFRIKSPTFADDI